MLVRSRRSSKQAGDTLIEVLFAMTVFGFIVVSALSLMNQGVSASQRSLEITTVRQEMDGQAEVLRFLHESYVEAYYSGISFNASDPITPAGEYYKIIEFAKNAGAQTSASQFGGTNACNIRDQVGKKFILNPINARFISDSTKPNVFQNASAYAQLEFSPTNSLNASRGIWIEAVRSATPAGSSAGYIDFHIRSCWPGPGVSTPMHLGTIVRLYEPRG
jgi:type II secretory pathway pseudopilin PulG